jgi:hypothetical protein
VKWKRFWTFSFLFQVAVESSERRAVVSTWVLLVTASESPDSRLWYSERIPPPVVDKTAASSSRAQSKIVYNIIHK